MRTLVTTILITVAPALAFADDPPVPDFDVTLFSVTGGADRGVIQRAYDETVGAASRCYSKLQTRPTGTLNIGFKIDDKGATRDVKVTGVASLNPCVAEAVKSLVFGTMPRGKVEVSEKLVLASHTAGVLGSTALQQGGAFASLTGTGDITGFDDTNIYGGLLGNEAGEMNGGFGYGSAGVGPGGSGTGWGTIGSGKVAKVTVGDATASNDADRAAINARIKREVSKIRACYEKALVADPKLAGKVTIKFRVEPTGKVSSATGSGLAKVDACVAMVIAAIEFAKPTAGAIDVSYPFVFVNEDSGSASGYGIGGGHGGLRGKTSAVPTVSIGQPNAQGDLDKAIIRRYIKRNIQKIQYCYEKQLLGTPGLAGTVTVSFTIGVNGVVTASTGSGLAKVDECVASVIGGIEFPKPKNGTVDVNYPFVFKPGE